MTLHRGDDFCSVASSPPDAPVLTADLESAVRVELAGRPFGLNLENEEGGLTVATVPHGGDDEVTGFDVVCHGLTVPYSSATLHSLKRKHHEPGNSTNGRQTFHEMCRLLVPVWPWYPSAAGDGHQGVLRE